MGTRKQVEWRNNMIIQSIYHSPIGELLIAVNDDVLLGVWMKDQKYYKQNINEEMKHDDQHKIIMQTKSWLDRYFCNEKPPIDELHLAPVGTPFRKDVWDILMRIPYGQVITYQDIARQIAKAKGIKRMSAQAIGGAVGHNPISIIIPCHRVVGTNGSLTGYAGGIEKKIALLQHEQVDMQNLFVPKDV